MHLNVSSKKDGTSAPNPFSNTLLMFTRAFWLVVYKCPLWFHVMWPPCSGVLESSSQTGQLWNISSKIFWRRVLQFPAQGKCLIAVMSYLPLSCSCLIWILSLLLFQAQRNNEDVNAIEPLFSVNIDHRVSPLNALSLKFKTQYN